MQKKIVEKISKEEDDEEDKTEVVVEELLGIKVKKKILKGTVRVER